MLEDPTASPASLRHLAERVSRAHTEDPEARAALEDLVQGFRHQIATRHPHLMGCMDAAAGLVASLPALDVETAREIQQVAARLLVVISTATSRQAIATEKPTWQTAPPPVQAQAQAQAAPTPMAVAPPRPRPRTTADADGTAPQTLNDLELGDLLVQLGIVTQAQMDRAVRDAERTGRAVEDTLYAIGAVGPEDVFRAMKLKQALSSAQASGASARRPHHLHAILLGEILVSMRRITREQLEQALAYQRGAGVRVGEALVELANATWEDIVEALRIQEQRGGSSERNADSTVVKLD